MFFRVLAALLAADAVDRHKRRQQYLEFVQAQASARAAEDHYERASGHERRSTSSSAGGHARP